MTKEQKQAQQTSDTVKRLREAFVLAAAKLKPEDEPAVVYKPGCLHDGS